MEVVRFESSYAEPYPLQVQGESQYRENIEDACGYYGEEEGVNADDLIARLIFENENIYDPQNAVRIEIENKTVGYLSKPAAKLYRKKLDELGLKNIVGECYASVKGGFHKRDGTQADFGIRLDIILDELGIKKPTATPINKNQSHSRAKLFNHLYLLRL